MKKNDLFFNIILLPIDAIMIMAGFVIAYYLRTNWDIVPVKGAIWDFNAYISFCLYLLPLWITIFALEGLYNTKNIRRGIDELTGIFMATSAGTTLMIIWIYFSQTSFFSRLIMLYIWLASPLLVLIGRSLLRLIQRYLYRFGINLKKVLFIGWDNQIIHIAQSLTANKSSGYRIIGYLAEKNHGDSFHYLGSFNQILEAAATNFPDEIILSDGKIPDERIAELLDFANTNNIVFKVIPNAFEMKASNIDAGTLAGIPVLEYNRTPLSGWGKVAKRLVDIIGSSLGLIILSPLLLVVSILIKLDSPGPILFRQRRVSNHGDFIFYKFRTMVEGAHKLHEEYIKKYGNMFKLKNDPRVTRYGHFLRRTSIDELPQLINVFLGQMSLVGPRPPMPEEVKHYTKWQRQRLGIKPGITGLWQVSGRSDLNFNEWVKLDIYYIENWSLWLDIKILLKTIAIVLGGRGAY